ncbi:MAG: hypothetical protein ACK4LQ_02165 [Pararhodobacter sp.]
MGGQLDQLSPDVRARIKALNAALRRHEQAQQQWMREHAAMLAFERSLPLRSRLRLRVSPRAIVAAQRAANIRRKR